MRTPPNLKKRVRLGTVLNRALAQWEEQDMRRGMVHPTTAASTDTSEALAERSASKAGPAALAVLLGVFILFGAGFAGPTVIHDAAHDARHGFALPCH